LIIKYDFSNSTASVFINPELGTSSEPVADIVDNTTATFRTQLNNLWFRSQGSSVQKFNIGGVRVSSTWAEAVEILPTAPKLATPNVGTATDITSTGFTANWTTVTNAVGYDVKVYQGATLISTTNVSGQATTSLIIGGLLPGTNYTYKVVAKGNGTDFSDSDLSAASTLFSTLGISSIEKFTTDFGDGTWGTPSATTPASGAYPSSSVNGFNLVKSILLSSSVTAPSGEKFTNRILLDKNSQGAAIEFPVLTTVGEVEIVAATGSDAMSFRVDEWTGSQWEPIGTYTTSKTITVYTISILRNSVTKLRIANNTGSGLYVYKMLTRTYQEATELTLRTSSPTQAEVCFANLKKSITLTFNKNVEKATGDILLNGVAIPLNTCTVNENVVIVPVTLESIPGSNKNYTFTVSAGTFAELGNVSNLSKAISINFQTLKSVVYPTNYTALMDINYKNLNSTNTRMDVYYPTDKTTPVPVVINMHGGGWSGGFKEEQGGFNMYFNRGYAVVNVEYRLRGEALAPACVEDVRGALHYVLNHAQEWNIDVNKVIFQGGSAGGHLAMMGGYLQNNRIYDNDCVQYPNPIKIMAVIDKYGPCDFTQLMTYSSLIAWTGERFSDVNFVNSLAPITYVDANTPPTYIIHGDADPTIPYNQSVTLYAALQNAGVKSKFTTVPNGGHGGFPTEYNTLMETEIIQFLNEVLENQNTGFVKNTDTNNINISVSDNNISIHTANPTRTKVFNTMGKEILSTNEAHFKIVGKGLYIIKISSSEGESTHKVLIK
jgi:acetyl esterase/lipase